MSLDATRWAWKQQGLSMAQKLVLLSLADRAGTDNTAFPSYETLGNDTGANRKTIWRALSSLKELRLIEDTGERKGPTKGVIVWLLVGVKDRHEGIPKTEQFQNGSSTKSGTDSSTKSGTDSSTKSGIQNLSVEPTIEPTRSSNANALLVDSDAADLKDKKEILSVKPTNTKTVRSSCPYQQIVELYHEILPMCPRVKEMTPARKAHLRARWNGSRKRQNLEWWQSFFGYVAQSDFLTGNIPGYNGRKPFTANLGWLVKQENFVNVCEGKYEDDKPRQYAS